MAQDINIYCDESCYSNPEDPYLVIGAVKCPRERKRGIVRELDALKRNNGIGGEFGWKSVSRNKAAFYTTLIDWFLATDDLRFRCVVANKENLWSRGAESAVYVVYHQLLCHWPVPPNTHRACLDEKKNLRQRRVDTLRTKTAGYMPGGCGPACVGDVSLWECALARVADCLIGCMGHTWDGHAGPEGFPEDNAFKRELCAHLAEGLGRPSLCFSTWASEGNFNVFLLGE
mgnify:CR=1 FL=1